MTWTRICIECGKSAQVKYADVEGRLCRSCASKDTTTTNIHRRWVDNTDRVRYYYFCPLCPNVREIVDKRKTNYCNDCSKKVSKQHNIITYVFDFTIMDYIGRHLKYKYMPPKVRRTTVYKPKPKPKKKVSKKTRKQKEVQERKHITEVKEEPKIVHRPDLIEQWLRCNIPTRVETDNHHCDGQTPSMRGAY